MTASLNGRLLALGLALGLSATLTSACSTDPTDPDSGCMPGLSKTQGPLVLAVSTHANSPKPDLPALVVSMVTTALITEQPIRIINVDGTPEVVPMAGLTKVATSNCNALKSSVTKATNQVVMTVRAAAADSDGNNLYGAVALAADLVRSEKWDRASLILVDSGLTDETSAPVVIAQEGMLDADPDEVAEFAHRAAPLKLGRLDITLVSFGYSAPPQQPLDEQARHAVTSIWQSVLVRQGARVSVLPQPRPAEGPETSLVTAVTPVPEADTFEPPPEGGSTTVVFRDSGPLRFLPDSTELVEPAAARRAVADLAAWLAGDPERRAVVTGTTSSAGTEEGRLRLSKARAALVRDLILGAAEVSPDQVASRGVGNDFPERVEDRNTAGDLVPGLAARNRTVRVEVSTDARSKE